MLKVLLKENWDSANSDYLIKTPVMYELEGFLTKSFGSLLLSGPNGSGKTTIVKNRLDHSRATSLPVYIESPELEFNIAETSQERIIEKNVYLLLGAILSSLYDAVNSRTIQAKPTKWFKVRRFLLPWSWERFVMKESSKLKEIISMSEVVEETSSKRLSSWDRAFKVEFSSSIKFLIRSTIVFVFAGAFAAQLLSLIQAAGTGLTLLLSFQFILYASYSTRVEDTKEITQRRFGISTDEVTRSLRKIIHAAEGKLKPVFVVDELDYYSGNTNELLGTLKRLKLLFTSSKAQFIFIVSPTTFQGSLIDTRRTIFTDRIYLAKYDSDVLLQYLDCIVESNQISETDKQAWSLYKWYLLSLSDHSFYGLKYQIKSHTKYDSDSGNFYVLAEEIQDSRIRNQALLHKNLCFWFKTSSVLLSSEHLKDVMWAQMEKLQVSFERHFDGHGDFELIHTPDLGIIKGFDGRDGSWDGATIRESLIAAISSLYVLVDQDQPAYLVDPHQISLNLPFKIDWNGIDQNAFELLSKVDSFREPILSSEVQFNRKYKEVKEELGNMELKLYGSTSENIISTIDKLSQLLDIGSGVKEFLQYEQTFKSINHDLVNKRNPIQIRSNLEDVNKISTQLNSYIQMKGVVLHRGWGEYTYDENKDTLNIHHIDFDGGLDSQFQILIPYFSNDSRTTLSFKVRLKENSLLNILFFHSGMGNLLQEKFHFLRLDPRRGGNVGQGLLFKERDTQNWDYIEPVGKPRRPRTPSHKWLDCTLSIVNKRITLKYRAQGDKNAHIVLKDKLELPEDITHLGFANELGEVWISDLQIS